jgi:hypothetical protein
MTGRGTHMRSRYGRAGAQDQSLVGTLRGSEGIEQRYIPVTSPQPDDGLVRLKVVWRPVRVLAQCTKTVVSSCAGPFQATARGSRSHLA